MKKYLTSTILAAALLLSAVPVQAATTSLTQAQKQAIINLISSFGADQAVIAKATAALEGTYIPPSGPTVPPPPVVPEPSCALGRDLVRGMSGSDVACLQRLLAGQGLLSADSATGYFGAVTEAAVQRFQAAHGIVSLGSPQTTGYGFVGAKTRVLLMQIFNLASKGAPGGNATSTPVCGWYGQTLAAGQAVAAYYFAIAPYGESCVQETRVCSGDGTLSGSYKYATCEVPTATFCKLDAATVPVGGSGIFYSRTNVASGQSCASAAQTRTCSANGILGGDSAYQYSTCSSGGSSAAYCSFNGQTVSDGSSIAAYQSAAVPVGQTCISEQRTCAGGVLQGSYQYASCTATLGSSDTVPPTVAFTSPANNAVVSGTVVVSATASDASGSQQGSGVEGVTFMDGTATLADDTAAPYSFNWNTASVLSGPHTLYAVARDAAGNRATSTVQIIMPDIVR